MLSCGTAKLTFTVNVDHCVYVYSDNKRFHLSIYLSFPKKGGGITQKLNETALRPTSEYTSLEKLAQNLPSKSLTIIHCKKNTEEGESDLRGPTHLWLTKGVDNSEMRRKLAKYGNTPRV